ncbi:MAG: DUF1638 domain-containing protein [Candidatus Methanomethyliaceae archaeon]|nr:DUF1638 domain-containing protein [Candidatus Methanomethyliaceae archaeon]MDW7970514.1 DUF1638 domain-containing protein [Nitrososphaerota archaeon]
MALLSIIGCGMFEDEIAYILSRDEDIERIYIMESPYSIGLIKKLKSAKVISSEGDISKSGNYFVVVDILELALHNDPKVLKEAVYEKVREFSRFSDGILLFYGLCGSSLMYVERDLSQLCPLFILKDDSGEIVDDCIGATLGGREAYFKALKSFSGKGAFFLTPMWAANWKELLKKSRITPNPDDLSRHKFIFKYIGYEYLVKLDNGLANDEEFERNVRKFAEIFDLKVVEMKGSPKIAENTYERAKNAILKK